MKKILLSLFIMVYILTGCQSSDDSDGLKVAVSIGPQRAFVQAIGGDLVDVIVMIPPGYSPANYQPTPREMIDFNEAVVYFHLDVAAEVNIMSSISNKDMILVDLASISDNAYPTRYFEDDVQLNELSELHDEVDEHDEHDEHDEDDEHDEHDDEENQEHDHDHAGRDPHIWLSPRRSIVMVEEMIKVLSEIDPTNKETYETNGQKFIDELNELDKSWTESFSKLDNRTFLIYHPSYGYFSDDYNLNMIAIESEGKTATIKGLEYVIDYAREHQVKAIFYQDEFDSQQAEIVAKEIGGKTIKVSPLSEDYIESMKRMVEALKDILN